MEELREEDRDDANLDGQLGHYVIYLEQKDGIPQPTLTLGASCKAHLALPTFDMSRSL
jgi:hypothetical protein